MTPTGPPEELTPAERRLQEHLVVLRDAPHPPASLTRKVVRGARWQQAVRSPLLAIGHLSAAAFDAVILLLGDRRR